MKNKTKRALEKTTAQLTSLVCAFEEYEDDPRLGAEIRLKRAMEKASKFLDKTKSHPDFQ